MRSQGEVKRPLGLLYLKIHNETNFKKRCSGGWLYVYVAECTEHVGASSKEAVVVKRLLCIGSLVRSLWALARVRYGRLREICTLSLSDARVNDLTINTHTNWPSTHTQPNHQHKHNLTINTSTSKTQQWTAQFTSKPSTPHPQASATSITEFKELFCATQVK